MTRSAKKNHLQQYFLDIQPFLVPCAVLCYVIPAMLAYFQYHQSFNPSSNWLSDLGDFRYNPQGAFYYNFGIVSSGMLVLMFFSGLSQWKIENRKVQNIMVRLTQAFGILGSLAMVMSGVYPISNLEQHRFWSIALYILLGTAFGFSVSALRYHPHYPRWVLGLGILTALVDILSGIFNQVTVLEWITVALFLVYLLIINLRPVIFAEKAAL